MMKKIPEVIFLCGFSGSGKTEVGKILAERLAFGYTDTDAEVEAALNRPIPEIFAKMGEHRFRFAEGDVVRMAIGQKRRVVSLGGGAIHDERMLEHIKANGYLVYLRTSPETIYERLLDSHFRPMLLAMGRDETSQRQAILSRISRLLNEREPLYRQAHAMVTTDGKSIAEVVDEIATLIGQPDSDEKI